MDDLLVTAIIRSSHGVRGECNIALPSGDPKMITSMKTGILRHKGPQKPIEFEYVRGASPKYILKIKGLATPEQVNQLRGAEILRSRNEGPALEQNEYYTADLVGCDLILKGEKKGTVVSVWDNASSSMLEIRRLDDGIVHIPFLSQFIGEVETKDRTIELLVDWILE